MGRRDSGNWLRKTAPVDVLYLMEESSPDCDAVLSDWSDEWLAPFQAQLDRANPRDHVVWLPPNPFPKDRDDDWR